MSPDLSALETKLAAARTRLILEKPFLGALVMHLPLKAADAKWCKTTATDARNFYFNPDYIARLTLEQTQFVLAHEAMHCALSHFARRNHRQKHRWDVACDYAVNMILDEERMLASGQRADERELSGSDGGRNLPPAARGPAGGNPGHPSVRQRSAGEGGGDGEPQEQEQRDTGQGQENESEGDASGGRRSRTKESQGEAQQADESANPPPPPADPDKLDEQWKSRLAAAAQAARQAGKLSQSLMRFVDNLLAPQLPWRALLARYMMNAARDDYSFQRTSRREGEALMPRLYSQGVNVVVALDTSGSVTREELQAFLTEIDALKAQVRADVTLHACDDKLDPAGPWKYAMWEAMALPEQVSGGGGTDFRPVFEWLGREASAPICWSISPTPRAVSPSGNPLFRWSGWSRRARPMTRFWHSVSNLN
jgi:predicted metal-dependent peptidase